MLATFAVGAQTPVARAASSPGSGFVDAEMGSALPAANERQLVYRGPAVDTLATIRRSGVLRVGVAINEPMVMHDRNGALAGYSIDLARRLGEDLGVRVEFVETSWASVIPGLLEQRYDVIASGMWVGVRRALVVNFTQPAATEGIWLFTAKGTPVARSAADFNRAGMRIVVYADTVQEQLAQRLFPEATLIRVDGNQDHFAPVVDGRAQAVLVPTFAPQVVLKSAAGRLTLPLDKPIASAATAMAVRKGDADFVNFLDTWLQVRRDEGWLSERAAHWAAPGKD